MSQAARLRPLAELTAEDGQDGLRFAATGGDPQFLWTPGGADASTLRRARSLRVRFAAETLSGRLSQPCIYVDWGRGFSEEQRTPLQPAEDGVWAAVAHTQAGIFQRLRLDPSVEPCRFRVVGFEVSPVGELAARPGGSASEALKASLGPLRAPAAGAYARAKRLLTRKSPVPPPAGWGGSGAADPWRAAWGHAFDVARRLRSPHFAAPALHPPARDADAPKLLAYYLPQFHPFPENDVWWGKGFTEWRNVAKATPQFHGHYQPRLPADLGYYDLRLPDVLAQQVELARSAGVDGFCFHYYWFAGKRLLERPLDAFLGDPSLDASFALCWANENWTRRWDGREQDVLIRQNHSPADDIAVFDDIARYMADSRYVRIGGKPLLVVYRADALPEPEETMKRWRARSRKNGLGELHILCTDAFGFGDYRAYGFDGIAEFPPHGISAGEITDRVRPLGPEFRGKVYDYAQVAALKLDALRRVEDPGFVPGVMPGWDNEARKPGAGHAFHDAEPEVYRGWLRGALEHACETAPPEGRLVFINAWNEWAEGAYLEPDQWFGHAFLQATRSAVESFAPRLTAATPGVAAAEAGFGPTSESVVLLHVFYRDLIDWFAQRLPLERADLVVTFPDLWTEADVRGLREAFPSAVLLPVENRGRDVLPFLHALRFARAHGHERFLKLHSKRSPHEARGDAWRDRLVSALAAPDAQARAAAAFDADERLGLLAEERSRVSLAAPGVMHNNAGVVRRLAETLGLQWDLQTDFPAGTMFWGRVEAFRRLAEADIESLQFETELGRIDGTTAHGLERLMAAVPATDGFHTRWDL